MLKLLLVWDFENLQDHRHIRIISILIYITDISISISISIYR